MKKLIFNYKRWYCKCLLVSNLLIPLFILSSGIDQQNQLISWLSGGSGITTGLYLSTGFCFLVLVIGLIYTSKTFSSSRALRYYISWKKEYSKKLMLGISLHAICSLLLLSCVTFGLFWKLNNYEFSTYKYANYVIAGLCLILGVASNIYIHSFEFKNYFDIYYPRYKESNIKEALDGINQRKQYRQRALKS